MSPQLKAGDVFLTRGKGLISRAIRFFTRAIGERRTKVNHVGILVEDGPVDEAIAVEALIRIKRHPLWSQYGPPSSDLVAIYRPRNLSADQIVKIVKAAGEFVHQKYGFIRLAAHLADWFLLGAYVFRRLVPKGKYPICSWLVAESFREAGKHFGLSAGAASPDDIWDFVTLETDKYEEVYALAALVKEEHSEETPKEAAPKS